MSEKICIVKEAIILKELYDHTTRVVFNERTTIFLHYLRSPELTLWDVRIVGTNQDFFQAHADSLQRALTYLARDIKETWKELHDTPDSDLTDCDKADKRELRRIVDRIEVYHNAVTEIG